MTLRPSLLFTLLALSLSLSLSVFAENIQDLNKELRNAASVDDDEAITRLLDAGADVNAANQFGKTALMNAVENGNILTTSILLSRGADVNKETIVGLTALTFAAENGQIELTALLLERGAYLEARTRSGLTALLLAAQQCLRVLLKRII